MTVNSKCKLRHDCIYHSKVNEIRDIMNDLETSNLFKIDRISEVI